MRCALLSCNSFSFVVGPALDLRTLGEVDCRPIAFRPNAMGMPTKTACGGLRIFFCPGDSGLAGDRGFFGRRRSGLGLFRAGPGHASVIRPGGFAARDRDQPRSGSSRRRRVAGFRLLCPQRRSCLCRKRGSGCLFRQSCSGWRAVSFRERRGCLQGRRFVLRVPLRRRFVARPQSA